MIVGFFIAAVFAKEMLCAPTLLMADAFLISKSILLATNLVLAITSCSTLFFDLISTTSTPKVTKLVTIIAKSATYKINSISEKPFCFIYKLIIFSNKQKQTGY